jgi:hypothetical protein
LVTEEFLGPRPPGMQVDHVDGVKQHNQLTNLEFVTGSENQRRAAVLGLHARKLTNAEVTALRALAAAGLGQRQLAATFGVSRPTVPRILNRRRRPHV